jgi:hypothetical protein
MAQRGNPNWGKPIINVPPAMPSAFEMEAKRLGLTPETYAASVQLRIWCQRNCTRSYVPEWLLKVWHIPVDVNLA